MANYAKAKGRNLEHLIADTLTEAGIEAKRTPMSGALRNLGPELDGDVRIVATGELVECKFHANMKAQLWDWLEDNSYLAIKRNNKEPLMVMTLDKFIQLYKRESK